MLAQQVSQINPAMAELSALSAGSDLAFGRFFLMFGFSFVSHLV
jgi:hypothetical protein